MNTSQPDAATSRSLLISVLAEFHIPIEEFDQLAILSYEQQLAARCPDKLKDLYLALLKPGLSLPDRAKTCPCWPRGNFNAGNRPDRHVLGPIRRRLLQAGKTATGLPLEQRQLRCHERNLNLRADQLALQKKRLQLQLKPNPPPPRPAAAPEPDDDYDPIAEQKKAEAMIDKLYGLN